uniref:Secreted protein n=1 Tax=Steinernema glaseri TaxID=37863 RepID=A0A1I7YH31_9BILA
MFAALQSAHIAVVFGFADQISAGIGLPDRLTSASVAQLNASNDDFSGGGSGYVLMNRCLNKKTSGNIVARREKICRTCASEIFVLPKKLLSTSCHMKPNFRILLLPQPYPKKIAKLPQERLFAINMMNDQS